MIIIEYNEDEEMMEIHNKTDLLFVGNYWDFNKDPKSLQRFLLGCGLEVILSKRKSQEELEEK